MSNRGQTFNWTKVELKQYLNDDFWLWEKAFNWTKVELKQVNVVRTYKRGGLLIELR